MNISSINVFPLVKMDPTMGGSFMNRDGDVYSDKKGGLARLSGSRTPSGNYYLLNKRTHRADDLRLKALRHPEFAGETSDTPVTKPALLPSNKSRSATALVKNKGFVLAKLSNTDKLIFGTEPVFQLDEPTARAEAERIATLHPGERVVVLKAVMSVVANGTTWY